MSNIKDILIIGSGVTGSSASYLINKLNKNTLTKLNVTVIDKAFLPGGRLTTTYNSKNNKYKYNLGFKHINKINFDKYSIFNYNKHIVNYHDKFYFDIGFTDVFQPNLDKVNFINNSLVTSINYNQLNNKIWEVQINNHDILSYDLIISTIPLPQLINLNGNFINLFDTTMKEKIKNIKYNQIHSLGLSLNNKLNTTWIEKNTCNDFILDWICIESNKNNDIDTNIVTHCKFNWTKTNLYQHKNYIESKIINQLQKYIPELKKTNIINTKLMRWKYANIINDTNIGNFYNQSSIIVNKNIPFIIGGDSVCGSNFEKCLDSSYNIYKNTKKIVYDIYY